MRIYTKQEIVESRGRMILVYAETGAGKTVSTLLTAPDPIFYLLTENRNLDASMEVVNKRRPGLRFEVGIYEDFNDTMDMICNHSEKLDGFRTILVDSLTDLMAVKLSHEIQDEAYEARRGEGSTSKVIKKELISQSKLTLEGYGGIHSNTLRFTDAISRYSQKGKYVILTARTDYNPSWNREYSVAPLLKGKEYGKDFAGFFDLIGYVQPRYKKIKKEDGNDGLELIYPPYISFECKTPDEPFMCKWTGDEQGKKEGPLDISKILKVEN